MGKLYDRLDDNLIDWIDQQQMFFVATAPLSASGSVNCSPKGGDTLRILDAHTVAYQDYTGSGAETIAHLRENGRIVLMFCAFEGPPKILRLHGRGDVLTPDDAAFADIARSFPAHVGTRAIIRITVERIADACGYAVPLYDFRAPRDVLDKYSENKGPEGLRAYRREKNALSIDGLPALDPSD